MKDIFAGDQDAEIDEAFRTFPMPATWVPTLSCWRPNAKQIRAYRRGRGRHTERRRDEVRNPALSDKRRPTSRIRAAPIIRP